MTDAPVAPGRRGCFMPDSAPPKCPHCQVEFRAEDVAGRKTCPVCGGQLAEPRPPSAAIGCVVIIVFILLLYFAVKWIFFENKDQDNRRIDNIRTVNDALIDKGPCRTRTGFYSTSKSGLMSLHSIWLNKDHEAMFKAIQKPGNDAMQPEVEVYVVDTKMPYVNIRPKGKTSTAWTLDDFLDCDLRSKKTP